MEWPVGVLDVDSLASTGWRATPFRQFVLKVHGRCNLACDYCYMYQLGDRAGPPLPRAMSQVVIRHTASRIAEHAESHGLDRVAVSLHGGEPLLAGPGALVAIADELHRVLPASTALDLTVQTNGILLDRSTLDVLLKHEIRVGVSLDGVAETHDRHRRYRDGRGSYAQVADALRLIGGERYRSLFAGLLCVIDVESDPVGTYESLLEFGAPRMDFLLPHGNWMAPPPHRSTDHTDVPYGRWLTTVFDRWFDVTSRETEVRLFAEIINLALGGKSRTESVGLSPVGLITVNPDGALEQVDTLRVVHPGAPATGLNVLTNGFDEVLRHPAIVARQIGIAALSDTCQGCDIRRICGGGHYAHRFRRGSGYRNPSVYCPDLTFLVNHILGRLQAGQAGITSRAVRCRTPRVADESPPSSTDGRRPTGA
jgi:uncharacterized protein